MGIFATSLTPFTINDALATGSLYGIAYSGQDGPATFYEIDPSNGASIAIGPTGFERCSGMDFLGGILYATCERADGSDIPVLVTIDPTDGTATEVAELNGGLDHSFGDAYSDISFRNGDGNLYAYLEAGDGLGILDISNGDLTELGSTGVGCCGNGIAFDPSDDLWHTNENTLGTLDQAVGTQTDGPDMIFSPPMDFDPRINAMDWDDSTGTMYGSCNDGFGGSPENYLCTVDLTTGVVTTVGATQDGMDAIAFVPMTTAVAGDLLKIDTTALMLAGLSSNTIWMIAGLAGAGIFLIKIITTKKFNY